MSVFPQFFLAFVSGDFSQFAFSSAGHLPLLVLLKMTAQAALKAIPLNHYRMEFLK
jgi:hypothetical protein